MGDFAAEKNALEQLLQELEEADVKDAHELLDLGPQRMVHVEAEEEEEEEEERAPEAAPFSVPCRPSESDLRKWRVGDSVGAKCYWDQEWRPGRVTSVTESGVVVEFEDVGNEQETYLADVMSAEELKRRPRFLKSPRKNWFTSAARERWRKKKRLKKKRPKAKERVTERKISAEPQRASTKLMGDSPLIPCTACGDPIDTGVPYSRCDGALYHCSCTTCIVGDHPLVEFFTVNGQLVCPEHYKELNVKKRLVCSVCKEPVGNASYFTVAGKTICRADFERLEVQKATVCAECHAPVAQFYRVEGRILCADDYERLRPCVRCAGCEAELEQYFTHPGGEKVCPACHEKRAPRCSQCDRPCVGTTVTLNGKLLCADCRPRCCVCHQVVSSFYTHGEKLFCEDDFASLQKTQ